MQSLTAALSSLGLSNVEAPPSNNVNDVCRTHLTRLIADITGASPAMVSPAIQWSQSLDKGDFILATPALRLKGVDPGALALKLQQELDSPLIQKPVVDRTYVQLAIKPEPLASLVIPTILELGTDYGRDMFDGLRDPADPSKGRKRVIVDFGSPNIAKPFHAGHLRSTIIGGFLANLYEQANWEVIRLNYLGDWGKQYGVLGVAFADYGSEEELQRDAINHLFVIYVKASAKAREQQAAIKAKEAELAELQAKGASVKALTTELQQLRDNCVDERARRYFKRMCDGEGEELALWRRFRELSIEKYKSTFSRLNIHYDVYWGESQVKDSSMEAAAKILEEKGLSEDSEGAKIVDLTRWSKKLGKAIVRKKDGTSIYLTRDIGGVFERFEAYNFDKMFYVIANQQDLHMAQLIKIIELMGREDLSKRLEHINFGLVLGMSTRRGTVRFLDDILRDTAETMHEVMRKNDAKYAQVEDPEKTADVLGISAVIVQDMSGKRINNYTFDMQRMTSFEGDTGPYLQYSHARLCSIIRKADVSLEDLKKADVRLLTEKHAIDIVRRLAQWPDVFKVTLKGKEPVTVLTYLFRLTHALNSSYDCLNILKSEPEVKLARLALYTCVRQVLQNGMKILGLTPVERM